MRKYVVLDLDHTLICADSVSLETKIAIEPNVFIIKAIENRDSHQITVREHFDDFISGLVERGYRIIIWSAGSDSYVKSIVNVFMLRFPGVFDWVLTRNHVVNDKKHLILLEKIVEGFKLENCVLVDDSDVHSPGQEKYHIKAEYFDSKKGQDDYLLRALDSIDQRFGERK